MRTLSTISHNLGDFFSVSFLSKTEGKTVPIQFEPHKNVSGLEAPAIRNQKSCKVSAIANCQISPEMFQT
jgi:hypothetical protein